MEALELAIGLGMIRTAVTHANAQAQQPDGQIRQAMSWHARTAPGRAIVSVDAYWQAITAKRAGKRFLHCGGVGAPASCKQQVKAGVIIDERERMAPPGRRVEVALEIDLPEGVGQGMLKALPGSRRGGSCGTDQAMPVQDRRYRAWWRHLGMAQFAQSCSDLAPAPGGMSLPQVDDCLLN